MRRPRAPPITTATMTAMTAAMARPRLLRGGGIGRPSGPAGKPTGDQGTGGGGGGGTIPPIGGCAREAGPTADSPLANRCTEPLPPNGVFNRRPPVIPSLTLQRRVTTPGAHFASSVLPPITSSGSYPLMHHRRPHRRGQFGCRVTPDGGLTTVGCDIGVACRPQRTSSRFPRANRWPSRIWRRGSRWRAQARECRATRTRT